MKTSVPLACGDGGGWLGLRGAGMGDEGGGALPLLTTVGSLTHEQSQCNHMLNAVSTGSVSSLFEHKSYS